jgi:hypothetical protein
MTRRQLNTASIALASCAVFSGCSAPSHVAPLAATINESASLSAATASVLPTNPLRWRIITSAADPKNSTMSTLYGNDIAIQHARANSKHDYPSGSQIALVTWTSRDDPRYFGAKIPGCLKSVEFVLVKAVSGTGATQFVYEKFEGSPLTMTPTEEGPTATPRIAYLLSQRAAVLP